MMLTLTGREETLKKGNTKGPVIAEPPHRIFPHRVWRGTHIGEAAEGGDVGQRYVALSVHLAFQKGVVRQVRGTKIVFTVEVCVVGREGECGRGVRGC